MMRSPLVALKGSAPLLRKFLAELRKKHQQAGSASVLKLDAVTLTLEIPPHLPAKPHIACRLSATRARLSLCQPSRHST
jgi:hypothetical protein